MSCSSVRNQIFYFLPQGKPNPALPREEGADDKRKRVAQKEQKGPTCWYYAQKMIRQHYGKQPHSSFIKEGVHERIASSYRKKLTAAGAKAINERAIAQSYESSPYRKMEHLPTATPEFSAEDSIKKASLLALQFLSTAVVENECSKVFKLIAKFKTQTQCSDFNEFVMERQKKRLIKIHTYYLGVFKIDPAIAYQQDILGRPWRPARTKLNDDEKATYLSNLAIRVIAQKCYNLTESAWSPAQTIDQLIETLHDKGPLFVNGRFGKSYYQNEALSMNEKRHGKTIWYWPADISTPVTTPMPSHSIIIVGATTSGSRGGMVYFVDPQDGSDPNDPEKQKVYAISYQRLTQNIHDLFGEQYTIGKKALPIPGSSYAMHGNLKLKFD